MQCCIVHCVSLFHGAIVLWRSRKTMGSSWVHPGRGTRTQQQSLTAGAPRRILRARVGRLTARDASMPLISWSISVVRSLCWADRLSASDDIIPMLPRADLDQPSSHTCIPNPYCMPRKENGQSCRPNDRGRHRLCLIVSAAVCEMS